MDRLTQIVNQANLFNASGEDKLVVLLRKEDGTVEVLTRDRADVTRLLAEAVLGRKVRTAAQSEVPEAHRLH